jgi:hypothetical protein
LLILTIVKSVEHTIKQDGTVETKTMDVPQVVDQVIEEPPQASPELKTEGTQPKPSLIQDKLKTVTERSEITSSQMSGSDFLKDEIVDMNIPEFLKKTES